MYVRHPGVMAAAFRVCYRDLLFVRSPVSYFRVYGKSHQIQDHYLNQHTVQVGFRVQQAVLRDTAAGQELALP